MRKFFLLAVLTSLALLSSCVKSGDKDRGPVTPPPVVDNDAIDAAVFALLDRNNEDLKKVFTLYDAGSKYYAAAALLEHFRSRTGVVDEKIDLIAPSITPEQLQIADWALYKNSCKLYTEGFQTASGEPYAYLVSNEIDWTKCESGDPEQTLELTRLGWIEAQGLAYRTEFDGKYAVDWVKSMESFVKYADQSNLIWRHDDSNERLSALLAAWQYFVNAPSVTPAFTSVMLRYIAQEASRLEEAATAEDGELLVRLALVFGEFKDAQKWYDTGKDIRNKDYRKEWFEALNLDFPGMEMVKEAYLAGDYTSAAEAALEYWKQRSAAVNPLVVLPSSVSDADRCYAYYATKENEYRFYVKNYDEDPAANKPKSYLNAAGDGINWQKWPSKDQEERYQLNRHQWMQVQGKTYYVTRDEDLVRSWMEVYQDWFTQNPKPDHEIDYNVYPQNLPEPDRNYGWTWRPLDVAARIDNQFYLVEYYRNSSSITPAYLMWYLYQIQEQVEHVMGHYATKDGNQRITEASAVANAGLLFPEFAHSSQWLSNASAELNDCVSEMYYADGWLKDGDFSYHIGSIENFRATLEIARANDKTDLFPASYIEAIRKMASVVLNVTFPDYSSVNMCDTRMESYTKNVLKRNFTNYSNLFPADPAFKWAATEGTEGLAPSNLTALYPDAGYYVIRNSWGKSGMMMVVENATVSPNQRWHRQWDSNTFELYAGGRRFFTDSGCYTYNTGSQRSKYSATAAHNTLTLNGANVTSCSGRLLGSGDNFLVLENASYDNLTHRRAIFLVDNSFYVLVDEAYGNAEGSVNLHFHLPVAGTATEVVVDAAQLRSYTAFSDGNNILVKTFSPAAATLNEREGFLSVNIDKSTPRKAYSVDVIKTASDAAVRYITVLLPSSNPASQVVSASFPEDFSAGSVKADVTAGGKTYKLEAILK